MKAGIETLRLAHQYLLCRARICRDNGTDPEEYMLASCEILGTIATVRIANALERIVQHLDARADDHK